MVPHEPKSVDVGDATSFTGRDEAGWYVLANGRILVAADKTELTSWGDKSSRYHPQYREFRGYVDIRATDNADLPWNTSKTGVDEDHRTWQVAYGMMQTALRDVQTMLNRVKEEVTEREETGAEGPILGAIKTAKPVPMVSISTASPAPLVYPTPVQRRSRPKGQAIRFFVEQSRYNEVVERLGMQGYAPGEIGLAVFEYFERNEL
jgi:hypothetical protein